MPIHAKTVSSWVWKGLSIAKVHMSVSTAQGAVVSLALVAIVFLVTILQASAWTIVSTPVRNCF